MCSIITIDPIDGYALKEANNKEREARDAVVDQVEEVDATSGHHGKAEQEGEDDDRRSEDVTWATTPQILWELVGDGT